MWWPSSWRSARSDPLLAPSWRARVSHRFAARRWGKPLTLASTYTIIAITAKRGCCAVVSSTTPSHKRLRDRNVATAVILACQEAGLAQRHVGDSWDAVYADVSSSMYTPSVE